MSLAIIDLTPGNIAAALGIVGIAGLVIGYFLYSLFGQKKKVKTDSIKELETVVSALTTRVEFLEGENQRLQGASKSLRDEHERCQRKINEVTAFNLRLQAREFHYQTRINRLERASGLTITNFDEFTASPESSATG